MNVSIGIHCIGLVFLAIFSTTKGFTPVGRGRFGLGPRFGGTGSGGIPPSDSFPNAYSGSSGDDALQLHPLLNSLPDEEEFLGSLHRNDTTSFPRGGGSASQREPLASTASFWGKSLRSVTSTVTKPFRAAKRKFATTFRSKKQKQEDALMEKLKTTKVRNVVVRNSTVLPSSVVQIAARRAGLVGNPLRMDRVNDFAASLGQWYSRNGYVLHSVTGATLLPESATAEITVQEPVTAHPPVGIIFCKEMVVDEESGELMTFRQYKTKHETRKTFGFKKDVSKNDLNTTYVTTAKGRTRPGCIAAALGLKPGKPFQWNAPRYQRIASSGIFARILQASPRSLPDGTVQLQMLVNEAAPRHLEYGLARSLYTGSWEGEVDFEHNNIFGGGEVLGFSFRRGRRGPSGRLRFSDTRFGMGGGYDIEAFTDFIGEQPISKRKKKEEGSEPSVPETLPPTDYEHDSLDTRRGATFRLQNPINRKLVLNSVATASVERVSTSHNLQENIGSTSLAVGPFLRQLPLGAKSDIDGRFMVGARVSPGEGENSSRRYLPYSSVSTTTRQTFPLLATSSSGTRPLILALKHSLLLSSKSLPRHEARAQGISTNIRGAAPNDRVMSSLSGTTELRIPIELPFKTRQDASVVIFGDWLLAKPDAAEPFFRKSSVGLGLRKSLQGIPIKYDVSYSKKERKIKASFGLGRDFEL